jgi:hypothetical protein
MRTIESLGGYLPGRNHMIETIKYLFTAGPIQLSFRNWTQLSTAVQCASAPEPVDNWHCNQRSPQGTIAQYGIRSFKLRENCARFIQARARSYKGIGY